MSATRSTLATLGNIYEYESESIKSHALDMVEIAEVFKGGQSVSYSATAVQVAPLAEEDETGASSQEQLTRPLHSPSRWRGIGRSFFKRILSSNYCDGTFFPLQFEHTCDTSIA